MKNSLQIKTRTYGFFSSLYQIIDNLKYCEINNIKPIIIYDKTFKYNNNNENAWNNFFEPVNDSIPEGNVIDIRSCENQVELFFLKNFLMVDPFSRNFNLKLWDLYSKGNSIETYNHRMEINNLITKYIKPKEDILNEVKKFDGFEWNKILAVHSRGTDFCKDGNHLDLLLFETKRVIEKYGYEKIFIASDNQESINLFCNKFDNVIFYETSLRMDNMNNPQPIFHNVFGEDKVKQGKDVLIESILMSKCDRIICVNSNVSAYSCYLNPEIKINLVRKSLAGTGLY
jgi:hypothetical protein